MPSSAGPQLPANIEVGATIAGKYRIERVLGSGGMGVVVAASHVGLRQSVAIKFLLPKASGQPILSARLLREARAAAALKGLHVARVFDVDALADGSTYIVMEYLEGQTLAKRIESGGPLSVPVVVDWALEICEALAEAHAAGIVHRDLKPANLFLARGPGGRQTLRVLDFGIAKAIDREESTITNTDSHSLVGSPPYVSPEQLMSPREVDIRTDIWSLGVVMYECLTGTRPFRGETVAKLWDSILREPARAANVPLPSGLEKVVRRCLEKKPGARYADIGALARALAPFGTARARASLEVVAALAAPDAAGARDDETMSELAGPQTEEPMTRSSVAEALRPSHERLLLPAFALLAIGGLGAFLYFRGAADAPAEIRSSATNQAQVAVPSAAPKPSTTPAPIPLATTPVAPLPSSKPEAAAAPRPARLNSSRKPPPRERAPAPAAEGADTKSQGQPAPTPVVATPQRKPQADDEAVYSDRE